jgi:hypothetical protein
MSVVKLKRLHYHAMRLDDSILYTAYFANSQEYFLPIFQRNQARVRLPAHPGYHWKTLVEVLVNSRAAQAQDEAVPARRGPGRSCRVETEAGQDCLLNESSLARVERG